MSRQGAIILLFLVILIGLIDIVIRLYKLNKKSDLAFEYGNKLVDFLNKNNEYIFSNELFSYLNRNSVEMQSIMGELGILDTLIDPMRGVQYRNYQLIINGINDLLMYSNAGLHSSVKESGLMIYSSIEKYIGYTNVEKKELIGYLKNPFVWLREGIRLIIEFPIFFLYWTGLIQYSRYLKLKDNILFRLIKFLLGTLGFISTIMGIVTGYEPFINIIKSFSK